MSTTVKQIAAHIERLAPRELAEHWDNVGLMVGDLEKEVNTVYVALDGTSRNVREAIDKGANMIITHHPLIFTSVNRVIEQDVTGSVIINLIKNDVALYSAHTNFDIADGGMNDRLGDKLDIVDTRHFLDSECVDGGGKPLDNIGRVGRLDTPSELADYVDYVKSVLGCAAISYAGDPSEVVTTAAVCSGSGGDLIYCAYNAGADVYITSEIKHHEAQLALELGINLIDAGHFETENIICGFMEDFLKERFPDLKIISSSADPYKKR